MPEQEVTKAEVTPAYVADVKQRFEKIEHALKEAVEFMKKLGHSPTPAK